MAGNFWQSSHATHWLLDKRSLVFARQYDAYFLIAEEYQKLFIFFANLIQGLSEPLKLRQQVIATATVFFKRFYARNSLQSIDPLLLAPTCILLASKVEEYGVISNSRLLSVCQTVVKTKFNYAYTYEYPYRINQILECEFYLIESLDCCLIVYQPYRPLLLYLEDIGIQEDDNLLAMSWKVINDSLRTDVCLLYAPHQIALACMEIACVILQRDLRQWFAELNVNWDKVQEVARHIIDLFEMWSSWNEKEEIKELLAKMPKPRPAPDQQQQQQQQQTQQQQ